MPKSMQKEAETGAFLKGVDGMTLQNDAIFLTRGDSGALTVRREGPSGAPMAFEAGDVLYFTVKHFPGCAERLLQKELRDFEADGSAVFAFAPGDTKPMEPGGYWYDVQLSDADGGVTTLAGPALFTLGGEVTDE